MAHRVVWSRRALADLEGIAEFIAADSPAYAVGRAGLQAHGSGRPLPSTPAARDRPCLQAGEGAARASSPPSVVLVECYARSHPEARMSTAKHDVQVLLKTTLQRIVICNSWRQLPQ